MDIFERRLERFKQVAKNRQHDIAIVLENVHDIHNIGAILRTCDSVGIMNVYILNTEKHLQDEKKYSKLSSASGASKWLNLHFYTEVKEAVDVLKERYSKLYTTHLNKESKSIYEIDFSESCAIAFGNEHAGISEELLSYSSGNILIPQFGMVQSLNISVACAITLYELCRQKIMDRKYDQEFDLSKTEHKTILDQYVQIHKSDKLKNRGIKS